MKKRFLAFLLSLLAILSLVLSACGPARDDGTLSVIYNLNCMKGMPKKYSNATPLMWKVTDSEGGVAYLFGSIHVADKTYMRLDDSIMQAYLDCDALAVELDIVAINNDMGKVMQMSQAAIYPSGDNVYNHVPAELMDQFFDKLMEYPGFLASQGLSESNARELLPMFKPSYLSGIISSIASEKTGLSGDYGIDTIFLKISKELKKEILEIETLEAQANLLYNMSDTLGTLMLEESLTVPPEVQELGITDPVEFSALSIMSLYELWKSGDLSAFEQMVENDLSGSGYTPEQIEELEAYNKAMYDDRNLIMTNAVKNYLSQKKSVFVIVGEAHMVGEKGIVNMLIKEGYTVKLMSGNRLSLEGRLAA